MKNNVWIINQHISTPKLNGDGNRHYSMAKELVKKGYDVKLIMSSFAHVPAVDVEVDKTITIQPEEDGIDVVLVKGYEYDGSVGYGRIISMFLFLFRLFRIRINDLGKPDVIIVSSMSMLPILYAIYLRRWKLKDVKVIFEVRDIWPLTPIQIGGYNRFHPFLLLLSWM